MVDRSLISNASFKSIRLSLISVHEYFWSTGGYLFGLTAISIFLSFLPFFTDFGKIGMIKNQISRAAVLNAMESNSWQYAIVANIAVGVPVVLDFMLDVIHARISEANANESEAKLPRFVLILSLLLPNCLILLVAIPFAHVELALTFFLIRMMMLIYAVLGHLWVVGGSLFKSNWFVVAHFCLCAGVVCVVYDSINSVQVTFIFWTAVSFYGVAIVIIIAFAVRFLFAIKAVGFGNLSTAQMSCLMYLFLFACLGAYFYISGNVFRGEYDTKFFTAYTYVEAGFTLLLTALQVRLIRHEINVKEHTLQMKRNFVRFVSHEIRTPMNAVNMGLSLLRAGLCGGEKRQELLGTLEDVEGACATSIEILNDILSYEKLDAGLMTLEREQLNAWFFLSETARPFLMQARKQGVCLEGLDEGTAAASLLANTTLDIDKNRMAQVIRNLMSNALKFTPTGGTVRIETEVINDSVMAKEGVMLEKQKLLRVKFIDSGAGIAPQNIPKLFKEIIQFNAGKLQKGGGSGFGLFISKSIVDLHNGRISAWSEGEGHGCTFTLDIPAVDDEDGNNNSPSPGNMLLLKFKSPRHTTSSYRSFAKIHYASSDDVTTNNVDMKHNLPQSDLPQQSDAKGNDMGSFDDIGLLKASDDVADDGSDSGSSLCNESENVAQTVCPRASISVPSPMRVLVVDDAASNRKMLCRLLKDKYEICEAEDGLEAVETVMAASPTANPIDIILMDYCMPKMDGPTAARKLRDNGYKGIIIGVTGNALPTDIQYFISEGADRVATKPVNVVSLQATISELADAKRQFSNGALVKSTVADLLRIPMQQLARTSV